MSTTNRCQHPDTRTTTRLLRSAFWLPGAGLALLLLVAGLCVQAQDAPKEITNSIGMKLVLIPAGTFTMGSPVSEKTHSDNELQHDVTISKPYYMGVCEVTQKQWMELMDKNPCAFQGAAGGDDHPVEQVNYADVLEFLKKLSELPEEKKAGRVYRLPTEAEWEYACRAGTKTATHYGDSLSSNDANIKGDKPYGKAPEGPTVDKTTKVGSYKPNKFGLYDMHGNVFEWCSDWYDEKYYKTSPKTDPQGPATGEEHVVRGGDWYNMGAVARSAYRHHVTPEVKYWNIGFRAVMNVPGK